MRATEPVAGEAHILGLRLDRLRSRLVACRHDAAYLALTSISGADVVCSRAFGPPFDMILATIRADERNCAVGGRRRFDDDQRSRLALPEYAVTSLKFGDIAD